ncbi:MAG: polysaccharide biosynthesis tyrosine autokinase [Bacteroidales bacterium]|nr:polysaccharide biosynthesis tyrosine autokinase [Candidatus Sodaliphilus limicaballi]
MESLNKNRQESKNEDLIEIHDWLNYLLKKWSWFVSCIILALVCGGYYYLTTVPMYVRKSAVLIRDNESNSISNQFSQFSMFGVSTGRGNVYNEMITFRSPSYMMDVVKHLHLDMDYRVDGLFREGVLYGKNLPIRVTLADIQQDDVAHLQVKIIDDKNIQLTNFQLAGEEGENIPADKVVNGKFDAIINTPLGKVLVTKTEHFDKRPDNPIKVSRYPVLDVTQKYVSRLFADLNDPKASVIDLELVDESAERAEDILYALFDVYNNKWMDDINQQAVSTSRFIDEELKQIESELGSVDSDIASYKSSNNVPDVQTTTAININRSETLSAQRMELDNQKFMATFIRKQLASEGSKYQVLPANSGIESTSVAAQIAAYNENVTKRNTLIANSGVNNPMVVELDQTLAATRRAIISSLDNVIANLNNRLQDIKGVENATNRQISNSPNQAKYLLSVERQQKVKEQLYVFLLQKRAETQMTKAYNTRSKLLNPPAGSKKHSSPVKINVLIISLALGILVPVILLTLMFNLDTTVKRRKDIEMLTMPFVGEIPLNYKGYSGLLSFLNKRKEVRKIVVKEKSNDVINEAFRVVRTNLEFVAGKERKCNVIMFTSAFPGSGKTFVSTNLSTAFAINGKKVLLIDLDLRKGSTSRFVKGHTVGISNYLSDNVKNVDDIIVKDAVVPNLDIIPIGVIPPNPTELLYSNRLEELLKKLKDNYDFIFLDCPPLGIVADASIITKLCDMTIFLIRAGMFERDLLPEVDEYYREKRYTNLVLLLNGVKDEYHSYGRYGEYSAKDNKVY